MSSTHLRSCGGQVLCTLPMDSPFSLRITIDLGARRRVLGAAEIATLLHDPGLPGRLYALLHASPGVVHNPVHNLPSSLASSGEGGTLRRGEERPVSTDTDMNGSGNDRKKSTSFSDSFIPERDEVGGKGCRGRAGEEGSLEPLVDKIALHLAAALDDDRSLRFLRRIANEVPLRTMRWALGIALELEPGEIRKSRAAYFTTLIRPHLRSSRREANPTR